MRQILLGILVGIILSVVGYTITSYVIKTNARLETVEIILKMMLSPQDEMDTEEEGLTL